MAQQTQLIDGTNALDAQENALNMAEQMLAAKVTQYAKKTGGASGTTSNEAVLEDVPIGEQPHSLYLKAVDVGSDPSAAAPPQPGQTLVFHGIAYVSGTETQVLGFRQTT